MDPLKNMHIRIQTVEGKNDVRQIEVAPSLTIICHGGGISVNPAETEPCAVITPEDTIATAKQVSAEEWREVRELPEFVQLFNKVFEFEPPVDLAASTVDVLHVVGMIALIGKALSVGKLPFLKLPETYLHPKHQSGLADMLTMMCKGNEEKK